MSDSIIKAEGIGKRYRIRHQRPERYTALRDVITERVERLLGRPGRGSTATGGRGLLGVEKYIL